jgi:hypothetical protein
MIASQCLLPAFQAAQLFGTIAVAASTSAPPANATTPSNNPDSLGFSLVHGGLNDAVAAVIPQYTLPRYEAPLGSRTLKDYTAPTSGNPSATVRAGAPSTRSFAVTKVRPPAPPRLYSAYNNEIMDPGLYLPQLIGRRCGHICRIRQRSKGKIKAWTPSAELCAGGGRMLEV